MMALFVALLLTWPVNTRFPPELADSSWDNTGCKYKILVWFLCQFSTQHSGTCNVTRG